MKKLLVIVVNTISKVLNFAVQPINWLLDKIALKKLRGTEKIVGYTFFVFDKVLAYSYQRHASLAFWFSMPLYFMLMEFTNFSDVLTALLASAIMYLFGWFIEIYQKVSGKGEYDAWDAHVMLFFALLSTFLLTLIRVFSYHPYM
jgi:hypothetical protein